MVFRRGLDSLADAQKLGCGLYPVCIRPWVAPQYTWRAKNYFIFEIFTKAPHSLRNWS